MVGRLRRASGAAERHTADEGPFVSFTDLFIGILFLFLILVAALMLMHEEAVRRMTEQIRELQAKLDALAKLDINHPPFRLAIVYNSYQKPANSKEWTYSRTVQVYRTPDGLCLNNVILRNNLNLAWKPPLKPNEIPTPDSKNYGQMGEPCTLSPTGERWNSDGETGGVQRAGANLYSGATVLHKPDGDERIEMQYRILGIYDDYFRQPTVQASVAAPPPKRS